MKPTRVLHFILAAAVLWLASLACAQTETPSAASTQASAGSPTEEISASPALGELILEEKFLDNSNNWPVDKNEYRENTLKDGKYQVRTISEGYNWFYGPVAVSDADITVDMEFVEGVAANSDYGVLCRVTDADNQYRFKIASDGVYTIDKLVKGEKSIIIDWKSSPAIKTGTGVINTVRVICNGDHLVLYVNGALLADVVDSSLESGNYALMAGSYIGKDKVFTPAVVNFSNLTVRKPVTSGQ